jgi:hypothetical protein
VFGPQRRGRPAQWIVRRTTEGGGEGGVERTTSLARGAGDSVQPERGVPWWWGVPRGGGEGLAHRGRRLLTDQGPAVGVEALRV